MLDCGINVALGTDSLASNPDLSILHEARFLWRRDKSYLAPHTLLSMATINGAKALGFGCALGTLSPGKCADFVVLPSTSDSRQPWEELWESETEPIAVLVGGEPTPDQAANLCAGS
jgi:cytosine/adenosine deaminase-related metal-dependent hydrolase